MLLQNSFVAISQYRASSKLPRPPSSNCRVQRVRIVSSNEIELPGLTSSNCCIRRVQIAASNEFKFHCQTSSNYRGRRVGITASDKFELSRPKRSNCIVERYQMSRPTGLNFCIRWVQIDMCSKFELLHPRSFTKLRPNVESANSSIHSASTCFNLVHAHGVTLSLIWNGYLWK